MSVIKEHVLKRLTEILRVPPLELQSFFHLSKERELSLRLPLSALGKCVPKSELSKISQVSSDHLIRRSTFDESENLLSVSLDERNFIADVLRGSENRPTVPQRKFKKLAVEFSSPNIAKPFHVGHLRSTIVGQFAANILETANQVKRINYLGDWGTQFGYLHKGLENITLSDEKFQANPIEILYQVYVQSYNTPGSLEEARAAFEKLEKGVDTYASEWETIRKVTVEHLKKVYSLLGIHFDEYCYESDYRANRIQDVIKVLIEKGVAYNDNHQLVTDVNEEKIPLLRTNDSTLYLTRDIAAALDRVSKFECEEIVYVVDKSQSNHFKTLGSVLSRLEYPHLVRYLPFGRISGMSTRKGTSVFMTDILEESILRMAEQQKLSKNTRASDEDTTRLLGLTGLQVYILKHGRLKDFQFNWDHALQGTGDSGVKVQYTHSRLCSIEKKFNFKPTSHPTFNDINSEALKDPSVLPLVVEMARCDDVFREAYGKMESAPIVSLLFKLCNLTSRTLKNVPVKNQESDVAQSRLILFHKARLKIKRCMEVLGIKPLEQM